MTRSILTCVSLGLILLFCVTSACAHPPQQTEGAQPELPKLKTFEEISKTPHIIRILKETEIDVEFWNLPMRSGEAFGLLQDLVMLHGKLKLPILFDRSVFKLDAKPGFPGLPGLPGNEDPLVPIRAKQESTSIEGIKVRFTGTGKKMTAENMLAELLSQLSAKKATYLIRRGQLIITTKARASVEFLLKERISLDAHSEPVVEVIYRLADQTGASIVIDPRIGRKGLTPVSMTIANTATLADSLTMLTDMAGLRFMIIGEGIYVTTPQNANRLMNRPK